jgi:glycosyltransferase involved in cell wall biosynthesis
VPSKLIVFGDIPDIYRTTPNVDLLPYVRKSNPNQLIIYETLLAKSNFLLFPTRGNFTPHVICEANAFGMRGFSSRVAVKHEMVIDGVNGFTIERKKD